MGVSFFLCAGLSLSGVVYGCTDVEQFKHRIMYNSKTGHNAPHCGLYEICGQCR